MTDEVTTNVKCETVDKMGWAGLRRFSGTIAAADSSEGKYPVPMGAFKPKMVVYLAVQVVGDSNYIATMPYFDYETCSITTYSGTKAKITTKDISFDMVVMGDY